MSGDVQPRKRKDKKRKKDELGVEEPRGTAAVFGEGDVFMHSQHEHGTGGHWCAKIIFFSLLAVLVTLIGLIILENRGLTDLEANSVESRYTGVLEGWLEDAPYDGHHDEHTLELKQHDDVGGHDDNDDEDDEHSQEIDQNDEDETDDEEADDHNDEVDQNDDLSDEDDEDDEDDADENDEDDENSEEHNLEESAEDDDEDPAQRRYVRSVEYQQDDDDDDDDEDEDNDDDLQKVDENDSMDDNGENDESPEHVDENDQSAEDNDQSVEGGDDDQDQTVEGDIDDVDDDADDDDDDDDDNSNEDADNSNQDENNPREDEDEEEHDNENVDSEVEVEKLEKEISDEDALSTEEPAQPESKEDDKSQEESNEVTPEDDVDDEEEYLELDDIDEPLPEVEHIKVPAGKPLSEVEDETFEKPQDTLADEEEYEKQQEELRREEAEASHIWLKLVVGGALLAATHAVVRRATASRDVPDDHAIREETPAIDRRMTLIPEEAVTPATPSEVLEEPFFEEEIPEKTSSGIHSDAPIQQESEEDEDVEEIEIETKEVTAEPVEDTVDKELYSDEEEEDDDEEEEIIILKKETTQQSAPVPQKLDLPEPDPEPEEEVPDDVEIIEDEQLEEELDEEEEEDDISDVDDAELLSRLEAKYGRLPEPERPGQKHKDGGNSVEDDWPGEPSDVYWRQQLDQAEEELRQGDWSSGLRRAAAGDLSGSARGKWILARALDASADTRRDNALLSRAIAAYLDLLKMNERLGDDVLRLITNRTLDRIRFRGSYLSAEPVYRLLIRRFPDVPEYRNNLTVTFLMANRADLAEEAIKETLKRWPDDRVALAHYGFVLKTQHNRLEEAIDAFQRALKDDIGPATEPRFYYHLGDSLLLLGRYAEAHEVHKRGADHGHFLSPAQRSLYNVERLKSQPWWTVEQTPYVKLARALEKSWKEILKEGEAARALYEKEKEGLKERGEWSQLDLFVRGQEVPDRCRRAPVTCSIVRSEPAATGCRRGQVKFSSMEAGTHVRPHVGPTNCRLRMHLGLSNTKDTYIRVDQEIRQWQAGKVLMFDDSFEHEVWHNGTGSRLVLIVDVWHPELAPAQRRALPAI